MLELNLPADADSARVLDRLDWLCRNIDPADLAEGESVDPRLQLLPSLGHADPEGVAALLGGLPPVGLVLGAVRSYRGPDGDTLAVPVESDGLFKIHKHLARHLPGSAEGDYDPRIVLCKVRRGRGAAYDGDDALEGAALTVSEATLPGPGGPRTVRLDGPDPAAARVAKKRTPPWPQAPAPEARGLLLDWLAKGWDPRGKAPDGRRTIYVGNGPDKGKRRVQISPPGSRGQGKAGAEAPEKQQAEDDQPAQRAPAQAQQQEQAEKQQKPQQEKPDAKPEKAPAKGKTPRTDPAQAQQELGAMLADPSTADAGRARDILLGLTVAQARQVAEKLDVNIAGTASGRKADVVDKLASRLASKALEGSLASHEGALDLGDQPTEQEAPAPAPAPAPEPEPAPEPAPQEKQQAGDPAGGEAARAERDAVRAALASPVVQVDQLRAKMPPSMQGKAFDEMILRLADEGKLVLSQDSNPHQFSEERRGKFIQDGDSMITMIMAGDGLEDPGPERQEAPAPQQAPAQAPPPAAAQRQAPPPAPAPAAPAPQQARKPKAPPPPPPEDDFDDEAGFDLGDPGAGADDAGPAPEEGGGGADFDDLLGRSVEAGDGASARGLVDGSTAGYLRGAMDLHRAGRLKEKPFSELAYLASNKISRSNFPDDDSWQAAQSAAAEMLDSYSPEEAREALGGKLPPNVFQDRHGEPPYITPAAAKAMPAYADFLSRKLGIRPKGEAPAPQQAPQPQQAAPAPAPARAPQKAPATRRASGDPLGGRAPATRKPSSQRNVDASGGDATYDPAEMGDDGEVAAEFLAGERARANGGEAGKQMDLRQGARIADAPGSANIDRIRQSASTLRDITGGKVGRDGAARFLAEVERSNDKGGLLTAAKSAGVKANQSMSLPALKRAIQSHVASSLAEHHPPERPARRSPGEWRRLAAARQQALGNIDPARRRALDVADEGDEPAPRPAPAPARVPSREDRVAALERREREREAGQPKAKRRGATKE